MAQQFTSMSAQDQAFLRNWNTYCCDQDHGQSSHPSLSYPVHAPHHAPHQLSPPCSDQGCALPAAVCCEDTACPSVEQCCAGAQDCTDPACLGAEGHGVSTGMQTPCDDPACMGEGQAATACTDEECQFLEHYLACCSGQSIPNPPMPGKQLALPAPSLQNSQNPLLSPSSFDALLYAALEDAPRAPNADGSARHRPLPPPDAPASQTSYFAPWTPAQLLSTAAPPQSAVSTATASPNITATPPPPPPPPPTKKHICHWQNCHEQFESVSALLSHISIKHLETEPPAEILSNFGVGASAQPTPAHAGLSVDLGAAGQMDITHPLQADSLAVTQAANTSDGLLACLWDDCLPPVDPGAFASFPGWENHTHGASLSQHHDPARHSHGHAHANQQIAAVTALPTAADTSTPHAPASLDSATAVLKHLLQQHLGMDTTKGLLDMAAAHAESSTPPQPTASGSKIIPDLPHECRWIGCTERFDSLASLTDHLSEVHVGKGKNEYECLWSGCVVCDCDEGENAVECEHAHEAAKVATSDATKPTGKKFATRQKVMRHLQSHTGYRPYICPICKQGFSEPATLQAHTARHAREKPYECDYPGCDKAFSVAMSLKLHKKTHGEDQIYECPFCKKTFTDASNLRKHVRTHTGERPFVCSYPGCTKRFSRPDLLKRHKIMHQKKDQKVVDQRQSGSTRRRESGEADTSPSRGSVSPEIIPIMAV